MTLVFIVAVILLLIAAGCVVYAVKVTREVEKETKRFREAAGEHEDDDWYIGEL